ncbi:WecB/TagA/CpsF family glycosyltransferase [Microbacterium testaceum]|uniref:WecB/TagA/CpsF family glycosyltransferase n=1 Tax=Microbacterium testaceum TaxID=2033 RepID=UPI00128F2B2A|nr:WecB/TagA/CpsF family glycosyltransferase [Microbacterium testaceum]
MGIGCQPRYVGPFEGQMTQMFEQVIPDRDHPQSVFPTVEVGHVRFAVAEPENVVRWISTLARSDHRGINVRFANAWNVALANDDPEYLKIMSDEGSVNFPDGSPVVWVMNFTRKSADRAHRLRGPSMFRAVLDDSARAPLRHFFLGSSPDTLRSLRSSVQVQYPSARVVGHYSPPFATADESFIKECAERVAAAGPDLVWLGLGTPKQDYVGTAIAQRLQIPVLNVGAAFDFVANTVREAPPFIQHSGFEWLYRLLCEPRRLGKRYLYGNLRFVVVVVAALIRDRYRHRG